MSSEDPEAVRLSSAIGHAWRRGEPSDALVERAYRRFLQKQQRHRGVSFLRPAAWIALGTLLSIGSLYAATAGPWRLTGKSGGEEASRNRAPPHPPATPLGFDTARVPPALASSSGSAPAAPLAPSPAAARPSSAPSPRESWQRAARGLRERDFAAADDALRRLSAQGSRPEREAALLARAQLLLSQGQVAAALELSTSLASSADSSSTRHRAAAIASQARESTPSKRSFEPAPATNLP
jgi:hypothetical protein